MDGSTTANSRVESLMWRTANQSQETLIHTDTLSALKGFARIDSSADSTTDLSNAQYYFYPCDEITCYWDYLNDSVLNTTNVSYQPGLVEVNWGVMFLIPLALFGTMGNILVCMAISMEKRLQSITNYFLLSLAITDLLLSILVMPLSIINEFTGYWRFGPVLCNLFVTSDVLMCTSSILHLCTISVERYIGIRYPLRTRNKSTTVVWMKIILVWAIALGISSPLTVLGLIDETNVLSENQCFLNNDYFILYGSVFAFFIPLMTMIVTYVRTVQLLNQQAALCNPEQHEPMMRRSTSRRKEKATRKAASLRSQSLPIMQRTNDKHKQTPTDQRVSLEDAPQSDTNDAQSNRDTQQSNRAAPVISHNPHSHRKSFTISDADELAESSISEAVCLPMLRPQSSRLRDLVKKHSIALKAANILLLKKDELRTDRNTVQTEQKATKVLGVVFLIFVVAWAPFFIVNIMTVLCKECSFDPSLITTFVWLGYVSSTINPIIYTIFNRTFKNTFIKLLKCQYQTFQRSRRRTTVISYNGMTSYYFPTTTGGTSLQDETIC